MTEELKKAVEALDAPVSTPQQPKEPDPCPPEARPGQAHPKKGTAPEPAPKTQEPARSE